MYWIERILGWFIGKRNGGEYFFMDNCPDCIGTGRHRAENDTYFYHCASCGGSGIQVPYSWDGRMR